MPKKPTAVVVVSKEWVNSGVHHLVSRGRPSSSSLDTHILIAPLKDASDPLGLWLSGITTNGLTNDGSAVTMTVLVPWSFIYAVGVIEDENPKVVMGFVPARNEPDTEDEK
jgi:hypothetical protein